MKRFGTGIQRVGAGAAAIAVVALLCGQANAVNDILGQWTMESTGLTSTAVTGADNGPYPADLGTGTTLGHHAAATTAWSGPAGNGSAHSFSSNGWAVGDYYQFQTSATGVSNLGIQFDQVSSTTGPRDFKLQYSLNGTSFTDFGSYSVQPNAAPAWSSVASVVPPVDTYTFDLSSITSLNNAANVFFRMTDAAAVQANGTATAPPATGTDRIDNVSIYGNFNAALSPVTPMVTVSPLPAAGNIAFATNSNRNRVDLELLNGQATPTMNGGAKVSGNGTISPFTSATFTNFVKFDNTGGTAHNAHGNLLAVDAGASATAGGNIYSYGTQGTLPLPGAQLLATTNTASTFATRLSGLSVSPDNTKIALAGSDTGKVIVYDYTAGNTMGSGAALSGGRQTSGTPLTTIVATQIKQGTAWKDNNTVLSFSSAGQLSEINATTMAVTPVGSPVSTPAIGQDSTALAYNPSVSKYVYALYSGFLAAATPPTQNQLYIFDPTAGYSLVKMLNFNNYTDTSVAETARDIALDKNGNLFVAGDNSRIGYIPDVVSNPAALTDDSLVKWYQSETFAGSGTFSGLDIGFVPAGVPGDYNNNGIVDAADYAVWRKNLGQSVTIPNDPTPGTVTQSDYDFWKAHFGATSGAGSLGTGAVPEPGSIALLAIGLIGLVAGRRRFGR